MVKSNKATSWRVAFLIGVMVFIISIAVVHGIAESIALLTFCGIVHTAISALLPNEHDGTPKSLTKIIKSTIYVSKYLKILTFIIWSICAFTIVSKYHDFYQNQNIVSIEGFLSFTNGQLVKDATISLLWSQKLIERQNTSAGEFHFREVNLNKYSIDSLNLSVNFQGLNFIRPLEEFDNYQNIDFRIVLPSQGPSFKADTVALIADFLTEKPFVQLNNLIVEDTRPSLTKFGVKTHGVDEFINTSSSDFKKQAIRILDSLDVDKGLIVFGLAVRDTVSIVNCHFYSRGLDHVDEFVIQNSDTIKIEIPMEFNLGLSAHSEYVSNFILGLYSFYLGQPSGVIDQYWSQLKKDERFGEVVSFCYYYSGVRHASEGNLKIAVDQLAESIKFNNSNSDAENLLKKIHSAYEPWIPSADESSIDVHDEEQFTGSSNESVFQYEPCHGSSESDRIDCFERITYLDNDLETLIFFEDTVKLIIASNQKDLDLAYSLRTEILKLGKGSVHNIYPKDEEYEKYELVYSQDISELLATVLVDALKESLAGSGNPKNTFEVKKVDYLPNKTIVIRLYF